jgi:UDP-glucuronate 4-epimerase
MILVTGAAGFIGYHLSLGLLKDGYQVTGLDNLNDYYSTALKQARLAQLVHSSAFTFKQISLEDRAAIESCFDEVQPSMVVNLAAQAGVRYSLINPHVYAESNLLGFLNVLECCRHMPSVKGLIYASSSSVYGGNTKVPFAEDDLVDKPVSLYAATKKANELMAHTYSHLYGLHTTGLRFFTVYGPWGRPDMAYFSFTKAILEGKPIKVFNHGKMRRDFTYIDDIVQGIRAALNLNAPCEVFNLGNHRAESLMHFIDLLESEIGIKAVRQLEDMQPGDVPETYADIQHAQQKLGYSPGTNLDQGLKHFVAWYRDYYKVQL